MDIKLTALDFDTLSVVDANGEKVTYQLYDELRINEFNVQKEFYEQPSKYVYWTSLLERMRLQQESEQLAIDRLKAQLYEPSRTALIVKGTAKPTKDQIDSKITLNKEYQLLLKSYVTTQYTVQKLQYVVKAFEQRKDMLIQIGAELRRQKDYESKITQ